MIDAELREQVKKMEERTIKEINASMNRTRDQILDDICELYIKRGAEAARARWSNDGLSIEMEIEWSVLPSYENRFLLEDLI